MSGRCSGISSVLIRVNPWQNTSAAGLLTALAHLWPERVTSVLMSSLLRRNLPPVRSDFEFGIE